MQNVYCIKPHSRRQKIQARGLLLKGALNTFERHFSLHRYVARQNKYIELLTRLNIVQSCEQPIDVVEAIAGRVATNGEGDTWININLNKKNQMDIRNCWLHLPDKN